MDYFDEIHENLAKEDNNNNKKNTGTRDDDSSSKKFARYWMPDTCRKDRQMLRLKECSKFIPAFQFSLYSRTFYIVFCGWIILNMYF